MPLSNRATRALEHAIGLIGIPSVTFAAHMHGSRCWPLLDWPTVQQVTLVMEATSMILLFLVIVMLDEGRVANMRTQKFWARCKVCDLPRPPGSHHCRTCNACTAGFDHHCNILGTCVASNNRPWFIALIGSGGVMLACYAAAAAGACRALDIWVEFSWRSARCYAPAFFEGFYGGGFMLGLAALQVMLTALGLTQHTFNRNTCRAALWQYRLRFSNWWTGSSLLRCSSSSLRRSDAEQWELIQEQRDICV